MSAIRLFVIGLLVILLLCIGGIFSFYYANDKYRKLLIISIKDICEVSAIPLCLEIVDNSSKIEFIFVLINIIFVYIYMDYENDKLNESKKFADSLHFSNPTLSIPKTIFLVILGIVTLANLIYFIFWY
ncbi:MULTISPECIES: hypothetical protein [unclassified Lactobacillus]|uniref:hypothetical protein n=1 Tax=Lactobacillus TaxID=1578 RepID=UPI000BEEF184|nr:MULTISPECIES: hypothetical protein [unclassified Lactobacillus]MBL1059370.1 hypothetical protein [Lactobacillus sp. A27]PEG78876.1 hypothetical protein CP368_09795 [Lactobacillus sp. UMNPBX17]